MWRRLTRYAVLLIAGILCVYAGTRIGPRQTHRIVIDLSRPVEIEAPFEVVAVGDNGERGLWLQPGAGRGWKGEAGGSAAYRFYIPQRGTYQIWTLCRWRDACSNAVYATFADGHKAILGNDPVYEAWHWVRGHAVHLAAGAHKCVLSNHSDDVALLKLFLTNSPDDRPDLAVPVFDELFWDGFDGCDDGNFALWEQVSGEWAVQVGDPEIDGQKKILVGRSHHTDALLALTRHVWNEVVVRVSVRMPFGNESQTSGGICFGLRDDHSGHQLRWCEGDREDTAVLQVVDRRGSAVTNLATFDCGWEKAKWHEIEIGCGSDAIHVRVDGGKAMRIPHTWKINGGIGLCVSGRGEMHFDNVSVQQIEQAL